MSALNLNVANGFTLAYKIGVPYYIYDTTRENMLITEGVRFMASGGTPPYAYNMTGNINSDIISLVNYQGIRDQYQGFADLRLADNMILKKADIGVFSVQVTCTDYDGNTVTADGTVTIVDSNIPYKLSYRFYSNVNSAYKHLAYFKTGLFGLTVSPRGFFVFQHGDLFKIGLRIMGEPEGKVILNHVKKPVWVEVNQPLSTDNYWEFSGTVDADLTYDKVFEWEIGFKDKVSDDLYTAYPNIPVFIVVRGKSA